MFKKSKIFIAIILFFLISTLSSVAVQKYEEIKVFYRDIGLFVDEKEVALTDEPFIYNDRVYVPIRFVAEALHAQVSWNNDANTVSIFSFEDFDVANPLDGERFVYGEILKPIDTEKRTINIYQHFDDNSVLEERDLKVSEDVIIILQRSNKKINLDFEDLKVGDIVGMVVNKENEVRGIIVDG